MPAPRVTQPNDTKVIGGRPYEIIHVIDRNPRTAVYRALSSDGEPVILKRLRDRDTALHAQRAFSILQGSRDRLKLAGIPDILFCDDEWKVSTFVEGVCGYEYASDQQGLTIPQICAFVQSALCPIEAYMDEELVHGDLKPSNFIVDINPDNMPDHVVPIDHDILGRVGPASINPARIHGTSRFMAPEQCFGQYHKTTDIFSLAVTALDFLASKRHRFSLRRIGYFNDRRSSFERRAYGTWLDPEARTFLERQLATTAPQHEDASRRLLECIFLCVRNNSGKRPQTAKEIAQILP